MLEELRARENIEGFVLHFGKHFVKLKTDWYNRHSTTLSKLHDRNMAKLIIQNKDDDILAFVNTRRPEFSERILALKDKIQQDFSDILKHVSTYPSQGKDRKVLFAELRDNPYRDMIMRLASNQKVDVTKYYLEKVIPTFNTERWGMD